MIKTINKPKLASAKLKLVATALALEQNDLSIVADLFLSGYGKHYETEALLRILCPKMKVKHVEKNNSTPWIDHALQNEHLVLSFPYRQWPRFNPVVWPEFTLVLPTSKYGHGTEAGLIPKTAHGVMLCDAIERQLPHHKLDHLAKARTPTLERCRELGITIP